MQINQSRTYLNKYSREINRLPRSHALDHGAG